MVELKESRFQCKDGSTLHLKRWNPVKPWAIVIMLHGMKDHSGRYLQFASFLSEQKISVIIPDHRGHGLTAKKQELGYLGGKEGWNLVLDDIDSIIQDARKSYPALPLYLLGHSMGAQLARHFVLKHPTEIDGLILSGAMQQPRLTMLVGIFLASLTSLLRGSKSTSQIIEWLSFGNYNKRFEPARTKQDWVCNDPVRVDDYINSPFCGFDLSVSAYRSFFRSHLEVRTFEKKGIFPNQLPVFIYGGAMDSVSRQGKQLMNLRKIFIKAGVDDVEFKLYPDGRHEIHNDLGRFEVFRDVGDWVLRKAKSIKR
jgi:alpha-beta hydrolase superfamily lysophospholipase